MFKLSILGENDKVVKTYQTSVIKYGLIEDFALMSDQFEGKDILQQFVMLKPILKRMFKGLTDEELADVNIAEVLTLFKQLMAMVKDGYGKDESEKN